MYGLTDGQRQLSKMEEYVSHQSAKLKDDQQGDQIKSLMFRWIEREIERQDR